MSHHNAGLTRNGRRICIEQVFQGLLVPVAKEIGISRTCPTAGSAVTVPGSQ